MSFKLVCLSQLSNERWDSGSERKARPDNKLQREDFICKPCHTRRTEGKFPGDGRVESIFYNFSLSRKEVRKCFISWHTQHILQLYGKGPFSERGNWLPPLPGLLFPFSRSLGIFYMQHLTDRVVHTIASCGALAGTRNSSMGPPWGINPKTHHTVSWCSTTDLNLRLCLESRW